MTTLNYQSTVLPNQDGEETQTHSETFDTNDNAIAMMHYLQAIDIGDLILHSFELHIH